MRKLLEKLGDSIADCAEKLTNKISDALKPHFDRGDAIVKNSVICSVVGELGWLVAAIVYSTAIVAFTLVLCGIGFIAQMLDGDRLVK